MVSHRLLGYNTSRASAIIVAFVSLVFSPWHHTVSVSYNANRDQTSSPKEIIAPNINVMSVTGKETLISYKSARKPTVLYIFAETCRWCERNLDNINALAKMSSRSYRYIGLSLTDLGLKDYIRTNKLQFPVYTKLSQRVIDDLGLGNTPQTIVISPEGKVIKNWIGAYGNNLQQEIESYFKIKLPGTDIKDDVSQQRCVYCARDGLLFTPGAIVKAGDRRVRCKQDGRWTDPY